MAYDIIIPNRNSTSQGDITEKLRGYKKPSINNIIQKNAPAFITVVKYNEGSSGDYKFSTKSFGETTALSNKFFLQSISEVLQEKTQILESFGEPLILFFDERTKVHTFRGTFLDAAKGGPAGSRDEISYNWAAAFRMFYNEKLRGTKLADNNEIAFLTVNDQIYIGYPTSLSMSTDSNAPLTSAFSMTWIVVKQLLLPPISTTNAEGIPEYIKELKDLYSVDMTLTGIKKERIAELKGLLETTNSEIDSITEELEALKSSDPNDERTAQIKSLEQRLGELKSDKDGYMAELASIRVGN